MIKAIERNIDGHLNLVTMTESSVKLQITSMRATIRLERTPELEHAFNSQNWEHFERVYNQTRILVLMQIAKHLSDEQSKEKKDIISGRKTRTFFRRLCGLFIF